MKEWLSQNPMMKGLLITLFGMCIFVYRKWLNPPSDELMREVDKRSILGFRSWHFHPNQGLLVAVVGIGWIIYAILKS
ncbi:MAG: hypothetical protein H6621_03485 [Halobacteriovoraceae bacterium]|nr:hypothetical protein [Halobacteriovoraceae bacterium]MCB9094110.1 hypothetical protein [Halobacteriovoraceae bacterium]